MENLFDVHLSTAGATIEFYQVPGATLPRAINPDSHLRQAAILSRGTA
jgi:hypothetical protein